MTAEEARKITEKNSETKLKTLFTKSLEEINLDIQETAEKGHSSLYVDLTLYDSHFLPHLIRSLKMHYTNLGYQCNQTYETSFRLCW